MAEDRQEDLLKLLEAHGKQFLASFGCDAVGIKHEVYSEPGPSNPKKRRESGQELPHRSEDEWFGFEESEIYHEDRRNAESSEGWFESF